MEWSRRSSRRCRANKQLFVIARNSSFTYKGGSSDIKQVGRELGVRYVLEGSVRKSGNRVRIAGQLIDASTGGHIWADRFDGALDDIFELQDQVTSSVVGGISVPLVNAEIDRARTQDRQSPGVRLLSSQLGSRAALHRRRLCGSLVPCAKIHRAGSSLRHGPCNGRTLDEIFVIRSDGLLIVPPRQRKRNVPPAGL